MRLKAPLDASGAFPLVALQPRLGRRPQKSHCRFRGSHLPAGAARGTIKFADKRLRRAPERVERARRPSKDSSPGSRKTAREWRSLPDWKGLTRGTRTAQEAMRLPAGFRLEIPGSGQWARGREPGLRGWTGWPRPAARRGSGNRNAAASGVRSEKGSA